ncbi:MAG: hypothetical protein VX776_06655, partial [Planctomycetota bacterium]|nr:hypothetical protein [Planctomycetota bacterium]
KIVVNSWRNYIGKRSNTYIAIAKLDEVGKHVVLLQSSDFKDQKGLALDDWNGITELQLQSADKALPAIPEFEPWNGSELKILRVEWEGGELRPRPKPFPINHASMH